LAIGFVVGCATTPPPIDPDAARSGSRLKLAWYEFADGFRTWAPPTDLFDAELAVACSPTKWTDGFVRCTPAFGAVVFADAQCTQPLLAVDASFGLDLVPGCGAYVPAPPLYRATTQTVQPSATFERLSGTCMQVPTDPQHPVPRMAVAVAAPVTTLVAMSHVVAGGGPLAVEVLRGDDGLAVPLRLVDPAHAIGCDLSALDQATDLPCRATEAVLSDDLYVDARCLAPAVHVDPSCPTPPLGALPTYGCPIYYALGAESTAQMFYQDGFNTCGATNTVTTGHVYPLAGRVELARLSRAAAPGSSREQLVYVASGGARFRDEPHLYDGDLGAECTIVESSSTPAACRPNGAALIGNLFSDPSCTTALPDLVEIAPDDGCVRRATPTLVDTGSATFRIGSPHVGAVYQFTAPVCEPFPYALADVGAQLDPSRIATAMKVRDP
jgi:hypothetical protein